MANGNSPESFAVRISNADASGEPIAVRAAVYGSESATVTLVSGATPLEVRASGRVLTGMVQAVDSAQRVRVDLVATDRVAGPYLLMCAVAHTVLLGDNLTRDTGRFIRGAP